MDKSRQEWSTRDTELVLYGEFGYSTGKSTMDDGMYGKLEDMLKRRIKDGMAVEAVAGRLSKPTEDAVSKDLSMALLSDVIGELFAHGGRLDNLRIIPAYRYSDRSGVVNVEFDISIADGSIEVSDYGKHEEGDE